jgi:long-chain acyl-CoA synthetase
MKTAGVSQLYIHGESIKASLVAIVVPDEDGAKAWASSNNMANASFKEICQADAFRKGLLAALQAFGKSNGLKGFELPRNIYVESSPFSIENDLLTPSFKVKRHDVRKRYAPQFTALYQEISE